MIKVIYFLSLYFILLSQTKSIHAMNPKGLSTAIIGLRNWNESQARHGVGSLILKSITRLLGTPLQRATNVPFEVATVSSCLFINPNVPMNEIGQRVFRAMNNDKLERIIIIHDDVSLPLAKIKFESPIKKSAHGGVRSILSAMPHVQISRLRFGIGKPRGKNTQEHVSSQFDLDELKLVERQIIVSADLILQKLKDEH